MVRLSALWISKAFSTQAQHLCEPAQRTHEYQSFTRFHPMLQNPFPSEIYLYYSFNILSNPVIRQRIHWIDSHSFYHIY